MLKIVVNVIPGGPGDLMFVRNKLIIMEPRDLQSTTLFEQNQVAALGPLPGGGEN